jgi:hypothetical protein
MPEHHIRYDLLAQQALRGVVRTVLADAAKKGLPGEHHFKITFNTAAPGVRLSDRLRAQYPETMTIILQHQFWDLAVGDRAFEVGLSFGGISERLAVPFESIIAFYDPAVQFGFQFEAIEAAAAGEDREPGEAAKAAPAPDDNGAPKLAAVPAGKNPAGKNPAGKNPAGKNPAGKNPADKSAAGQNETAPAPADGDDKPDGGGEVVRLDRFRKK